MTKLEKEKVLERKYYNVGDGFVSVRDLYMYVHKTLDMVSDLHG